jgi:hypothetical protein
MTCGYQLVKCTGCQLEILKKNLTEHQSQCQQITTICAPREIVYEQNDTEERHSDIIFLREQLQQLRQDSQYEIQQLKEQIRQAQSKKQKDQMRSIYIDYLDKKKLTFLI